MITIPAGVRVLLATRPVDFRNYAECLVMRSARPDASITAVYPPTPLRIIKVLLDAHRIEEDAYAEFHDDPHGPYLVS